MEPITCPEMSSIDLEFHPAFNQLFATGQVAEGFSEHVLEHPLREDEVIVAGEEFAFGLQIDGHKELADSIRAALPPKPGPLVSGTPEFRKFKREKMMGKTWKPSLDVNQLGAVIAHALAQISTATPVVHCGNSHEPHAPGSNAGRCVRCGKHLGADGQVIRVGVF